jgi:hypothetical protein
VLAGLILLTHSLGIRKKPLFAPLHFACTTARVRAVGLFWLDANKNFPRKQNPTMPAWHHLLLVDPSTALPFEASLNFVAMRTAVAITAFQRHPL